MGVESRSNTRIKSRIVLSNSKSSERPEISHHRHLLFIAAATALDLNSKVK